MEHNIYWERQRGDLCRLHSINAYFGYKKIDEDEFFKYCSEYDEVIKGLKTIDMDGFAEGRCIISYILDKLDKQYVYLIPINTYNGARSHIDIERYNKLIKLVNGFFEFNKGHVWFNKKINGNWYKIDSISGVNIIDVPSIRKNGILLIIDDKHLYNEIFNYLNLVDKSNKSNKSNRSDNNHSNIKVILINLYYDEELYKTAMDIDWQMHMESRHTLSVQFIGTNYEIKNTQFGAVRIKDAIVDQFVEEGLARPSVERKMPDFPVYARLQRDNVIIGLDMAGASLHQRSYRQETGDAPLKEHIACAMLMRSGWTENMDKPLADMMCGSGTIAIEAAFMARNIAPGIKREYWGFSKWLSHDAAYWDSLVNDAIANQIEI